MHDLPRQKLSELLAQHGPTLCDDARRLEGLLKDVLRNEYKRETFVLVSALREGVAVELRGSTRGLPPEALAAKLVRQLRDNLAFDEQAARWAVESWCLALGVAPTVLVSAPPVDLGLDLDEPPPRAGTRPSGAAAGVDLVALAKQQQLAAQQAKARDAQSKAKADQVQAEAKRLAEQARDFATAARMIEELEPRWRNAKLYAKICGYRDQVARLEAGIRNRVEKGRLKFLRGRVQDLLKLQPKRDDMRQLLEVLPEGPDLPYEFTNSIGMRFVLIESGEFMMGSNESSDEEPPHAVEITQPFYLGVFPVTQGEYQSVIGSNPSLFSGKARHPVEQVSWDDAVAYCEKLSQRSAEVQRGASYRLPTEAEWEYACRAGSTGKWCCGDNVSLLGEYAWFDKNSGSQTHPVGEKKANAWGLHDMHGNVWEWCQDVYDAAAYGRRSGTTSDPLVTTGSKFRVLRGGAWLNDSADARSAYRNRYTPDVRLDYIGFRLVLL